MSTRAILAVKNYRRLAIKRKVDIHFAYLRSADNSARAVGYVGLRQGDNAQRAPFYAVIRCGQPCFHPIVVLSGAAEFRPTQQAGLP